MASPTAKTPQRNQPNWTCKWRNSWFNFRWGIISGGGNGARGLQCRHTELLSTTQATLWAPPGLKTNSSSAAEVEEGGRPAQQRPRRDPHPPVHPLSAFIFKTALRHRRWPSELTELNQIQWEERIKKTKKTEKKKVNRSRCAKITQMCFNRFKGSETTNLAEQCKAWVEFSFRLILVRKK